MKTNDHRVDSKLTAEHGFQIADPDLLFDRRLVERHIRFGHTSAGDYKKHLEGLEDCADLGTYPEESPWDEVEEAADDGGTETETSDQA